jgi:DNA modification methylase
VNGQHVETPQRAQLVIRYRDIESLIPYAMNARTHSPAQIAQIAASIREFGWTNPVLVDEAGGIIAGHGRVLGGMQAGYSQAPTIELAHLTPAQKRAYVIADNKIALNAGWNEELLAAELAALKAADFDVDLVGFDERELHALLGDAPAQGRGGGDKDRVPAAPLVPFTRLGDVWILGPHRLVCGDCREETTLRGAMDGRVAAAVWTDPPYNVAYQKPAGGKAAIANDDLSAREFALFLERAFARMFEALQVGGAVYVAHADTEGLAFRTAFAAAGFKLSACLVWKKNALVLGRSDYQWQHEPILYGWKPGAAHRWYGGRARTTIAEFAHPLIAQTGEREWQITLGDATLLICGDNLEVAEVYGTVMEIDKPARNALHPTMKPVALIERQLRNSTRRGDLVFDPFAGSGSTLMACQALGRVAALVEIEPKHCDVIVARWEGYTGERALRLSDGAMLPSPASIVPLAA